MPVIGILTSSDSSATGHERFKSLLLRFVFMAKCFSGQRKAYSALYHSLFPTKAVFSDAL
jgi:hypothetical protein